jgi:hypothetical protein
MAKAKLPEGLREKVKELYQQGHGKEEVFRLVKSEGLLYLKTEDELMRCLKSLKGKARLEPPRPPTPPPPKPKEFDTKPFKSALEGVTENTPGNELEAVCRDIAKYVLEKYEGFQKVVDGPRFRKRGRP